MDKVLCLVETYWTEDLIWMDDQEIWMDLKPYPYSRHLKIKQFVTPLINHPHSDKENGQNEIHYHIDSRYIDKLTPFTEIRVNLPLKENQKLEFRFFKKIRDDEKFKTGVSLISKSKLKHKCIHKGKCPHRGFDLNNEKPDENGIITCPLHSLMFDTKDNNKIINLK